jgi:hypothetical protein
VLGRARSINANLNRRSDDRLAEMHCINTELIVIARRVVREADSCRECKEEAPTPSVGPSELPRRPTPRRRSNGRGA